MDHRKLNQSGSSSSSLFTTFSISFITLIAFTLVLMSNFSMQPQRDEFYSEVKIEIKREIQHLPLSSEKETHLMMTTSSTQSLNLKKNEKKKKLVFNNGDNNNENLSNKFEEKVIEFISDDRCEVNFVMTWISSAELFGKREVFAIESLFNSHPHGCLIILSSTMDSPQGYTTLKPFLVRNYKVLAVTPDLPFLVKDTAGESWLEGIRTGEKDPGKISLAQNLSNLMRLAYLYRYGGVYLDTDVIVLKSFKGLRNVIGAQRLDSKSINWTRLNNAVLIFNKGHPLLLKFIEEFANTFNGNVWGYNGPYLVSRVVRAVEGRSGYSNFTVMRPSVFYPVNWLEVERFFKVPKTEKDSKWVKVKLHQMKKTSYGLHLWNKFSKEFEIEEGSVMWRLVSEHCIICEIGSSSTS